MHKGCHAQTNEEYEQKGPLAIDDGDNLSRKRYSWIERSKSIHPSYSVCIPCRQSALMR